MLNRHTVDSRSLPPGIVPPSYRLPPGRAHAERGVGLIISTVVLLGLLAVALITSTLVRGHTETAAYSEQIRRLQARTIARSGMEVAVNDLRQRVQGASITAPFATIDAVHNQSPLGTRQVVSDGELQGEFVISYQVLGLDPAANDQRDPVHAGLEPGLIAADEENGDASAPSLQENLRDVIVTVTSFVPSRTTPPEFRTTHTIEACWRLEMRASDVFQYAYFINNWGWFYGDSIVANGNVRANGQFDFGGYRATINGHPEFALDAAGRLGDERSSGGVYAGWDVINAQNARGMAADSVYLHPNQPAVEMPNLSDLGTYEQLALDKNATIRIGNDVVVAGVLGDDSDEPHNLYLEGTPEAPIQIDGPVVVRGSVIIKGTVTGIGTIYAEGNIHIADDVVYANPPDTPVPTDTSREGMQAWIDANQNRDLVGLFARENIVIGDPSNKSFKSYVGGWLNHGANESKEDLGLDGLPQTAAGRDGVAGTGDDDVLEGDGVFSVSTYDELDALFGRIPEGKEIGDPIPGTGEDVDGDGAYDPRISLADFDLPAPLDDADAWAGNVPDGASKISDVASIYIRQVDGALYTNHAIAARVHEPADDITFNGALVSRVEAIVYSVPAGHTLTMNHDARLLTGGEQMDFYLPRTLAPVTALYWVERASGSAVTEETTP